MITKVFKNVLIIYLVVVISLPTNAAISVSDGSAFVTKAEFSADLNNLSNRMAQLENSLDAKIDSLVSAYLTRNGIWNGAKQTITNSQCQAYYTFVRKDGYLRSWHVDATAVTRQSDYSTSSQYMQPQTKYKTNRTAFTAPLNKSGLVYCKFDLLPWGSQRMVIIPRATGGDTYMQGMNGSYSDWMQITNQNNVLLYRDDAGIGLSIGGSYYLPIYYDRIVFFFSSKNDVLYFETDASMSFDNISTDDFTSSYGRKWIFKDVTIY